MITGIRRPRPQKPSLAAAVAEHLGLAAPDVSAGGSVDGQFLGAVLRVLNDPLPIPETTYRRCERVLEVLDESYDPWWDTSEYQENGGGTVTTRAFSRILVALTGQSRCFILSLNAAEMDPTADVLPSRVVVDAPRPGSKGFLDAGPGSRVLLYSDAAGFFASATVTYIGPTRDTPWSIDLVDVRPFLTPVSRQEVSISGWNARPSFAEISADLLDSIAEVGQLGPAVGADDGGPAPRSLGIARRLVMSVDPSQQADDALGGDVPASLPKGVMTSAPELVPQYSDQQRSGESPLAESVDPELSLPTRRSAEQRELDKAAEGRAVELVVSHLSAFGWTLTQDLQREGVGYDLEFSRGPRVVHVEVKGIQGPGVVFNVTEKEWWRVQTDDQFIVCAVTRVLSPGARVHFVTRDRLAGGERRALGYRVRPTPEE